MFDSHCFHDFHPVMEEEARCLNLQVPSKSDRKLEGQARFQDAARKIFAVPAFHREHTKGATEQKLLEWVFGQWPWQGAILEFDVGLKA